MTKRLTDAEILNTLYDSGDPEGLIAFARAIESAELERSKQAKPIGEFTVHNGKTLNEVVYFEPGLDDGDYKLYAAPQTEPVNQMLLAALKRCKFDSLNMSLDDLKFCRSAIAAAERGEA